jgi:hypothetical protein
MVAKLVMMSRGTEVLLGRLLRETRIGKGCVRKARIGEGGVAQACVGITCVGESSLGIIRGLRRLGREDALWKTCILERSRVARLGLIGRLARDRTARLGRWLRLVALPRIGLGLGLRSLLRLRLVVLLRLMVALRLRLRLIGLGREGIREVRGGVASRWAARR